MRGRRTEEEGDDRKQVGEEKRMEGERVNSHVTGSSCSVDGKREIQPQKKKI